MHRADTRLAVKTASVPAVHIVQGVCWTAATVAAVFLMIRVGTTELAGSPLALAGMLLLGAGLVKHVKSQGR